MHSGTTYVTETIFSSFQPFTPTFSSHKASRPRTPRRRDLINDNPASSKNFPDRLLFPSHPPLTKPSTHPSNFTQKACTGAFVLPIPHLEFALAPDFIPPSRIFRASRKGRPLPFAEQSTASFTIGFRRPANAYRSISRMSPESAPQLAIPDKRLFPFRSSWLATHHIITRCPMHFSSLHPC
jgi:hypothetical protein